MSNSAKPKAKKNAAIDEAKAEYLKVWPNDEKMVKYCQGEISNAVKLMEQNRGMNISDIAFSCGFDDPLYFSKVFRQYKGISPSEYMKNQA